MLSERIKQLREQAGISQSELARRLDMGRATLYRALETLEKQEVIWRSGKTVLLNRQEYKEEEK